MFQTASSRAVSPGSRLRVLGDLARGLRTGLLTVGFSPFMIRYAFPDTSEPAAAELAGLLASGIRSEHAAMLLDVVVAERTPLAGAIKIELATSGPDATGRTRDTGVILRPLFAGAERRVLIVGFAVRQGREIFAVLAERMRRLPALAVSICIDVRCSRGDTTGADALLRRFAERFLRQEWPGPRPPEAYYDPRSLREGDAPRASLHAKCAIVDSERTYVGSANFTEAAQLRNREIGLVVTDTLIANALESRIEALIAGGHLRPIPLAY